VSAWLCAGIASGNPRCLVENRFAARGFTQRIAFGNALAWYQTKYCV
jgi:hypothetical protein